MKILLILSLLGTLSIPSMALMQNSTEEADAATQHTASSIQLGGRLMFDYGSVTDQSGGSDLSGFDVRSARLTVNGTAQHNISYKAVADVAGDNISFKDVHVQYTGAGFAIIIGQSKEAISQDGQAGKTNSTFMERSSIAAVTGLTHQLGIAMDLGDDHWGWKTGLYLGSLNSDNKGAITMASRAVYGGTLRDATWGVAASLRFRNANNQTGYDYKVKAHNHFSPDYLDTALSSQKDTFYGFDVAYTQGPFHAAVEVGQLTARTPELSDGNHHIDAGYIEAGYFLTGEKRTYDLQKGKWGFSEVINPFSQGGLGAIQLVARYDIIDMSGKTAIAGGNQKTLLLGLNWWPYSHTRFVINYNNSKIKNGFTSGLNNAEGKNSVHGLGLRLVTNW